MSHPKFVSNLFSGLQICDSHEHERGEENENGGKAHPVNCPLPDDPVGLQIRNQLMLYLRARFFCFALPAPVAATRKTLSAIARRIHAAKKT